MRLLVTSDTTPREAVLSAVEACDAFVNLAGLLGTSEPLKRADDAVRADIRGAVNANVQRTEETGYESRTVEEGSCTREHCLPRSSGNCTVRREV